MLIRKSGALVARGPTSDVAAPPPPQRPQALASSGWAPGPPAAASAVGAPAAAGQRQAREPRTPPRTGKQGQGLPGSANRTAAKKQRTSEHHDTLRAARRGLDIQADAPFVLVATPTPAIAAARQEAQPLAPSPAARPSTAAADDGLQQRPLPTALRRPPKTDRGLAQPLQAQPWSGQTGQAKLGSKKLLSDRHDGLLSNLLSPWALFEALRFLSESLPRIPRLGCPGRQQCL